MRLSLNIQDVTCFNKACGLRVLEIGVGLGADHQQFAEAGADLCGVDLTERAIKHKRQRLAAFGLNSNLAVGDAENLNFPNASFDRVYSWGVLHHSPDTPKAIAEVLRVLKPGGVANIMVYHNMELCRANALDSLRPVRVEALADAYRNLLNLFGKPRHQSLFGCRGAATVF